MFEINLSMLLVDRYNHTRCKSLSDQTCMTQPTLIKTPPNEHSQETHYY